MILNSSQQYRLWQLANNSGAAGGTSEGGEVEFVIEGDTLRGVLKNTNRKIIRSRRKKDL
jgi:hypothetical protein